MNINIKIRSKEKNMFKKYVNKMYSLYNIRLYLHELLNIIFAQVAEMVVDKDAEQTGKIDWHDYKAIEEEKLRQGML